MPKASPAFSQVTPHIFRLELPFFIPVNVWLVSGPAGWTVVDAGAPRFEDIVFEQVLAQTGGALPRRLILTHGHLDHAAAAQRMREQWHTLIAAGSAEIPYLLGPARYSQIPSRSLLYRLLQPSPPPLVGRNVQLPLHDGMEVDGMQAFEAPGHAPGQIALLHLEDRALICGDAFANLNGKLGDPLSPFTYDMALTHELQARLATLDYDHLLASHGPPILHDGCARVRALVAGRRKERRPARG